MDIRQTDPGGLRQRLSQVLAARPLLRGLLRALGAGGFCFVLAGAGLLDGPVPLALAPVCVLPFGPAAICAYLGAAAGYAVFWGLSAALEPVAAGFLLLAGSCLLADLVPDEQGWLASAAAGGIYALLGVIFVLRADGGLQAALQLILRLVLLTLSVRMLSPAPANARLRPYAAAVCLLAGLVRVQLPFGVPLAVIPAAAICVLAAAGPEALAVGAACGLVLDLGSVPSPPQTACFCFSLLACRLAAGRKLARAAVFSGMYFLCVLVWGGEHAGWTHRSGRTALWPTTRRRWAATPSGCCIWGIDTITGRMWRVTGQRASAGITGPPRLAAMPPCRGWRGSTRRISITRRRQGGIAATRRIASVGATSG